MAIRINNGVQIGATAPAAAALTNQNLAIDWVEQQKSEWCWAACTEMILTTFDQEVQQCDVASAFFEDVCCPDDDDGETCNQGVNEEDILTIYDNFNVTATFMDGRVSFADIRKEIRDRGRPVQVCINWDEGGGHVIVVYGWRVSGSRRYLRIHDSLPEHGSGEVRFSDLVRYRAQGDWTLTWFEFDEA